MRFRVGARGRDVRRAAPAQRCEGPERGLQSRRWHALRILVVLGSATPNGKTVAKGLWEIWESGVRWEMGDTYQRTK